MNKPKISVVIPAYNEEKNLPICLASLTKQTFRDFEVIVVDNNSTDKTEVIARRFNARCVKETSQGICFARDKGFQVASAEFIAQTEADTTVPPDWLEMIYQQFHIHSDAIAITGGHCYPQLGKLCNLIGSFMCNSCYFPLVRLVMGHEQLTGSNYAVRKDAWSNIRHTLHLNNTNVHADVDLSCHLADIGKIVYALDIKVPVSLRRLENNFLSLFSYYIYRFFFTFFLHHPSFLRKRR